MTLLRGFLTFKLITFTDANLWMLGAIWFVLAATGVWSVVSSPGHYVNKIFWLIVIICLPIVGLFVYTISCLLTADWEILRQMGFFSTTKKRVIESINTSAD